MSLSDNIVFRHSTRIILRPILRDDVHAILRWINDQDVTQYTNAHLPFMEAAEYGWFDALHTKTDHDIVVAIIAVEKNGDRKHIGLMGLHRINWIDRNATTGAMIGEKEYWGKGYGSEAKMLLLDYAFNRLNLHKICSSVIEFNERSLRYSLRCGYEIEGTRKAHIWRHGRYFDEIFLAVFRENWLPLWEIFKKEHGIVTP